MGVAVVQRAEFLEIADLLGIEVREVGVGGSLYAEDIKAVAIAVGIEYQHNRSETWGAIIKHLGGTFVPSEHVSRGGTIQQKGLGLVRDLLARADVNSGPQGPSVTVLAAKLDLDGDYERTGDVDQRSYTQANICRRRGQPRFRRDLITAYEGNCAFSGCQQVDALEAAHIEGYSGAASNHPQNGLLLRADLHTLFDLGMLAVDSTPMTIVVSEDVSDPGYRALGGRKVFVPRDVGARPSREALDAHLARSRCQ